MRSVSWLAARRGVTQPWKSCSQPSSRWPSGSGPREGSRLRRRARRRRRTRRTSQRSVASRRRSTPSPPLPRTRRCADSCARLWGRVRLPAMARASSVIAAARTRAAAMAGATITAPSTTRLLRSRESSSCSGARQLRCVVPHWPPSPQLATGATPRRPRFASLLAPCSTWSRSRLRANTLPLPPWRSRRCALRCPRPGCGSTRTSPWACPSARSSSPCQRTCRWLARRRSGRCSPRARRRRSSTCLAPTRRSSRSRLGRS
mmetsp:Transcript_32364/g.96387  ORF Transcript_32364/g.96387 Transcript_32364/m.96387 type:complete len:261 (+) Transcript_32364:1036-1818(+)